MSKRQRLGKTGAFPEGKLGAHDEGELRLAVAANPRTRMVCIDFGTPVVWLALPPAQALELADLLTSNARKLES